MATPEKTIRQPDPPDEAAARAAPAPDYYEASQRTLMWRRFRKHKVALWMLHVLIVLYAVCVNCEFISQYSPTAIHARWPEVPPQPIRIGFIEGRTLPRLYVYPFIPGQDPVTLERRYAVDRTRRVPIELFVRGRSWSFLGLIDTDLHLFSPADPESDTCFLLGTDALGQDMLSRILHGGRISLLLGLTGVALTFVLGILFGGISGYYGGKIDLVIQRVVEVLQSVPKIPIWLAMGAAIPKNWTSVQVYFAMTMILACIGWTGLCRVVRGKLLALREEDYARAAVLAGASQSRVIFVHLIPNFLSHIIASLTLAIPMMILAETSLSFLGMGMRPPAVSLGVLLQEANSVSVVVNQPWMLLPSAVVIVAVLAFNFVGEGLRDAADPYST